MDMLVLMLGQKSDTSLWVSRPLLLTPLKCELSQMPLYAPILTLVSTSSKTSLNNAEQYTHLVSNETPNLHLLKVKQRHLWASTKWHKLRIVSTKR